MKRILMTLTVACLLAIAVPALAQQSEVISLNDATPAIEATISLPPDTTGSVRLNLNSAAVTLTDSQSSIVFHAADARLRALEFNLAPNSGVHTLKVERLPGITEAVVSIVSLPELVIPGSAELVATEPLNFHQELSVSLDATHPVDTVAVRIPDQTAGLISATFPGENATTQLIDPAGVLVAASYGGHIDGLNLVLDSGDYNFTVLANTPGDQITTGIRALPAEESGYAILAAPSGAVAAASSGADCTASVVANSVNLRSGPGTGYSVIDYGYRDQVFPVGGINPENNWFVIGTSSGSAWVSNGVAQLKGVCNNLAVFDIPLRDAPPASVIVVTPQPQIIVQAPSGSLSGSPSGSRSHDDDDDHDDDHGEDHDDD